MDMDTLIKVINNTVKYFADIGIEIRHVSFDNKEFAGDTVFSFCSDADKMGRKTIYATYSVEDMLLYLYHKKGEMDTLTLDDLI